MVQEKLVNVLRGKRRASLLMAAAHTGALERMRFLLKHRADVNLRCGTDGRMALHTAADEGRLGALELLLASGATVDVDDDEGHTALGRAAVGGRLACITVLAKVGARLEGSEIGMRPLALAAKHNQLDDAGLLVARGALTRRTGRTTRSRRSRLRRAAATSTSSTSCCASAPT